MGIVIDGDKVGNTITFSGLDSDTLGDGTLAVDLKGASIVIISGIGAIGNNVFSGTSVTSITIPQSVTSIANSAFISTNNLTEINVDETNNNYSSIDGVLFDKTQTILRQYSQGNSRTSYTIPSSVTSINNYAFYKAINLTSITITPSVTSIGVNTFFNTTRLTSINVDLGNIKYSSIDGVLFNTDKTTLVKYPEGKSAPLYEIPANVSTIDNYAFQYATSLTSITIPSSVISIGDYVFQSATSLTSIYVDLGNINYSSDTNGVLFNKYKTILIKFPEGNSGLSYSIPDGVTSISVLALENASRLTSITIPPSVTSIGNSAFFGASSLTSITIPPSVTSIGASAFQSATSLTTVYIVDTARIAFGLNYGTGQFFYGATVTIMPIPTSTTGVSTGAIIGISIGTAIVVGGIITGILIVVKNNKKKSKITYLQY